MKRCMLTFFFLIVFSDFCQADGILSKIKNPKMRALFICQEYIKSISTDYNSTKVPYAKNYGSGDESYFAWNNRNPIKMPNSFGQLVPTTGSCIVDENTDTITSLTINGKDIISK